MQQNKKSINMRLIISFLCVFTIFAPCLNAQSECQIKVPNNIEAIRKSPTFERHGGSRTYWICGNSKVTFRTGGATLFIESGSQASLNDGNFTVYMKDGASIFIGARCQVTVLRERQARINGDMARQDEICPVLNYDYSEAPDGLCPKLPLREVQAKEFAVLAPEKPRTNLPPNRVDTSRYIPNTPIENPKTDLPTYDNRYELSAQTQVISQNKTLYQSSNTFWVCKGTTMWLSGDNNRVYIEKGARVTVLGNQNVILMKAGGALELGNGSQNELIYMEDTDLKTNRSKKTKFTKMQSIDFKTGAVVGGCQF
jgi:hypothetical protein